MHNNKIAITRLLPLTLATAVALATAQQAAAEIVLYDKDDTTFSTDDYINAFYVNSDVENFAVCYSYMFSLSMLLLEM